MKFLIVKKYKKIYTKKLQKKRREKELNKIKESQQEREKSN